MVTVEDMAFEFMLALGEKDKSIEWINVFERRPSGEERSMKAVSAPVAGKDTLTRFKTNFYELMKTKFSFGEALGKRYPGPDEFFECLAGIMLMPISRWKSNDRDFYTEPSVTDAYRFFLKKDRAHILSQAPDEAMSLVIDTPTLEQSIKLLQTLFSSTAESSQDNNFEKEVGYLKEKFWPGAKPWAETTVPRQDPRSLLEPVTVPVKLDWEDPVVNQTGEFFCLAKLPGMTEREVSNQVDLLGEAVYNTIKMGTMERYKPKYLDEESNADLARQVASVSEYPEGAYCVVVNLTVLRKCLGRMWTSVEPTPEPPREQRSSSLQLN